MLHDERLYSKKILMKQNEKDFKSTGCEMPVSSSVPF